MQNENLERLRKVEAEENVILICFTKDDVEGLEAEDGQTYSLTQEEWDLVKRDFEKCNDDVMAECWNLLEQCVRDVLGR